MKITADVPSNLLPLDQLIGWLRRVKAAVILVQFASAIGFLFSRNWIALLVLIATVPVLFLTMATDWFVTSTFRKRLIAYWMSGGMDPRQAREVYAERYW